MSVMVMLRRWGVVALAASMLVVGASAANAGARAAETRPDQWFQIVDTIPGNPLALVAPGPNDVWVATSTGDGLAMAHYDLQAWEITPVLHGRTATAGSSLRPAALSATAPDDIWLAAGGGVAHYDGMAWRDVAGPTGPQGHQLEVTTLVATAGRVYVGTRDADAGGRVWRRSGEEWVDLGGPSAGSSTVLVPHEIKIVRGTIMVDFTRSTTTDSRGVPSIWWHDGRRWSSLYRFPSFEMFS